MNSATELARVLAIVDRARVLGVRRLDNGAELVGHVPHVAPEAWFHLLFPPLEEGEITELERNLGMSLDRVFHDFLSQHNGISLFSDSLAVYGVRKMLGRRGDALWGQPYDILTPNREERPRNARREHLIVGSYEDDGSLVVIDTRDSSTFRSDRDSITRFNAWKDFYAFLGAEAARLSHLFDRSGKKIREGLPTTPPVES